ncbi:MAG: alpha/beta fold hydrolase [Bacteroidota bacterium]
MQPLLLLAFIVFFSGCRQMTIETDPVPTDATIDANEAPAFNRELIINIAGDSIAAYALIAKNKTPKATVILIPGYPGNDNNFDLAQALRKNAYNVILFNHRGAWGSQGQYSYSNCLEDVEALVDYFGQTKVAADLRIAPDRFSLIGRSYGGGIALLKGHELAAVKNIIAITSVNYGSLMQQYNSLEELSGYRRYMRKQIMMQHDIDAFLQELLDKKNSFNIANYKTAIAQKRVLLIDDSDKNKDWIDALEGVQSVVLPSDHNFIETREQLIQLVLDWMKEAPK